MNHIEAGAICKILVLGTGSNAAEEHNGDEMTEFCSQCVSPKGRSCSSRSWKKAQAKDALRAHMGVSKNQCR